MSNFKKYKYLILSDLYRITGKINFISFIKRSIFDERYKFLFLLRTCNFSHNNLFLKFIVYPFVKFLLNHYRYKYGYSIPFYTTIGSGFYIGHFGGIVINEKTIIGKNCNISHGVTIGQANRGQYKGCPILGNNVFLGPGAKIFGNITIGDNVAIGANSVVVRDVPANAVVVGNPGTIKSFNGSAGYVNRTDYEAILNNTH